MADSGFTDELLYSRISDAVRLTERRGAQFIGFLDEHQRALALSFLKKERVSLPYMFWGGYPDAQRTVLGIFPHGEECLTELFPIALLEAKYRAVQGCLTHRDFLGALMSMGIKREVLGDILTEEGRAVIPVTEAMADYIVSQADAVGRARVDFSRAPEAALPEIGRFEMLSGTVASARLDCVLSCALKISRSGAAELVRRRLVNVDFLECTNVSKMLEQGQTLSVRGFGRFFIEAIGPFTKKGRLAVKIKKYI